MPHNKTTILKCKVSWTVKGFRDKSPEAKEYHNSETFDFDTKYPFHPSAHVDYLATYKSQILRQAKIPTGAYNIDVKILSSYSST